jgi:hypothetical protein
MDLLVLINTQRKLQKLTELIDKELDSSPKCKPCCDARFYAMAQTIQATLKSVIRKIDYKLDEHEPIDE